MRIAAIILSLVGTMALAPVPATGQTPGGEASITLQPSPANRRAVVRITLRDHKMIEGRLLGLTDSGIVVRTGGKNRTFDRAELLSVKIIHEADTVKNLFAGALLAIFCGPVAEFSIRHTSDATPFFADSMPLWGALLATALTAGSGMVIAPAISAVTRRRTSTFGKDLPSGFSARDWEDLRSYTAGGRGSRPAKLSLTADTGWTLGQAVEGALAGHLSQPADWERSRFNRLRRLRLEYAVAPALSLGGAYAWLGEPSADSLDNVDANSPFVWVRLNHDSRGYFLTLTFHPLKLGRSRSGWDLAAGVGAGAARLKLSLTDEYSYNPELGFHLDLVSKTVPSLMAYASAGYSLSRGLSFGISADWTWAPGQMTEAIPWSGPGGRRITFSGGCFGFYLGLHI